MLLSIFLWLESDFVGSVHFVTYMNDRMWLRFRQFQVLLFSDLSR